VISEKKNNNVNRRKRKEKREDQERESRQDSGKAFTLIPRRKGNAVSHTGEKGKDSIDLGKEGQSIPGGRKET